MSEAEIAALVAQAVAEHDSVTSWGEELARNAETIVSLLGLFVAAGVFLVGAHIKTRLRLQSLEDYRKAHDHADKASHEALETKIDGVDKTLTEFRQESSAQHNDLATRVTSMARDLNQLIGIYRAQGGRDEQVRSMETQR